MDPVAGLKIKGILEVSSSARPLSAIKIPGNDIPLVLYERTGHKVIERDVVGQAHDGSIENAQADR